ncbi:hypothetical protein LP419_36570 [Massilia sp. H-1]|nr:hypothetical protein LP419_36570 [Massilia sp. H-1]
MLSWRDALPVSHGELLVRVQAWRALALRTPGSRIALYLDDSIEFA